MKSTCLASLCCPIFPGHIDLSRLAAFASARLVHDEACGIDPVVGMLGGFGGVHGVQGAGGALGAGVGVPWYI